MEIFWDLNPVTMIWQNTINECIVGQNGCSCANHKCFLNIEIHEDEIEEQIDRPSGFDGTIGGLIIIRLNDAFVAWKQVKDKYTMFA